MEYTLTAQPILLPQSSLTTCRAEKTEERNSVYIQGVTNHTQLTKHTNSREVQTTAAP